MPSDNPGIGRRKLLSSVAVIGASSGAAGVGTWSLFADTSETRGQIRAGTLELSTANESATSMSVGPVSPGDEGIETVELENEGSVPGSLCLAVGGVAPSGRRAESKDDTSGGGDGDTASSGVVTEVEFSGCGTADIVIAENAKPPVEVTATVRRGDELRESDYTIAAADLKRSGGSSGRENRASINPKGGKLVRVTTGERTWRNPSPCAQPDEHPGSSGDLLSAITAEIGFTDDPAETGSALFGPSRLDEIRTDRTVESDRTLTPVDDTGRTSTFLYAAWKASDELEQVSGDEHIAIELRPELQT
jgi:predicted ribosomally synthesized peptide with SipW-like signal peptide